MSPETIEALRTYGLLILLAPLAGAIVAGAFGARLLRDRTHWVSLLGVGVAFVGAVAIFVAMRGTPVGARSALIPIYDWISAGTKSVFRFELLIDPLTSVMLLTVTGISMLVVIYSRDYMRDHGQAERGYHGKFMASG